MSFVQFEQTVPYKPWIPTNRYVTPGIIIITTIVIIVVLILWYKWKAVQAEIGVVKSECTQNKDCLSDQVCSTNKTCITYIEPEA